MEKEIDVNGEWDVEILENGVKIRLLTIPSQVFKDKQNSNVTIPVPTQKDNLLKLLDDPQVKNKIKLGVTS